MTIMMKNFSLKILVGGGDSETIPMAALTTDGASVMDGTKMTMTSKEMHNSRTESPGPAKMVGAKKKYRSRSASASSVDSASSGSYTGYLLPITNIRVRCVNQAGAELYQA